MSERRRLELRAKFIELLPPGVKFDVNLQQEVPSVVAISRYGPNVLRMPHVVAELNACLDWSSKWTITQACKANLLHLVRKLIVEDKLEPFDCTKRNSNYRQWQFEACMLNAVSAGNLEMVRLLSTEFVGCHMSNKVMNQAVRTGKLEIVEWLAVNRSDAQWVQNTVTEAIARNHFELAKWLEGRIMASPDVSTLENRTRYAAQLGNLPMLQWIVNHSAEINLRNALMAAVDHGCLEIAKWLVDQGGIDLESRDFWVFVDAAVDHRSRDVLEWVSCRFPGKMRIVRGALTAARNGCFDIVRMLHTNDVSGYSFSDAFAGAAEGGHLDIIKWLDAHSVGYTVSERSVLQLKPSTQNTRVFSRNPFQPELNSPMQVVDLAARNGHLGVVNWLVENTSETCTAATMDGAAENGHLGTVKWLHENWYEGCTTAAMDGAARNGHLDVVQWLHGNRTEGCTADAMDGAAANGYLDVVRWLHATRREGCTTRAMIGAARNGHLEVVTWLSENRTEGCTTDATDAAAELGRLEVVRWLNTNRNEGCTTAAFHRALYEYHLEVAWFLLRERSDVNNAYFLKRFQSENEDQYWALVEWVYVHKRTEFEYGAARYT